MKNQFVKKVAESGFTLIELLVVMTIMPGTNRVGKSIIVWSLGPDGIDGGSGAKDNVVTW